MNQALRTVFALMTVVGPNLAGQTSASSSDAMRYRDSPAMAYDSRRGVVVLFGGGDGLGTVSNETWEWNGTRWTRRDVTGPTARFGHSMAFDSRRGRIVMYGGGPYGGGPTYRPNSDTWEYDGTRWELRATDGPGPRGIFGMAYDSARGKTVLYGGMTSRDRRTVGETWEWDGTNWQRTATPDAPPGVDFIQLAYDARRQRVIAFGGHGNDTNTWSWDGLTWTKVAAEGPPSRDHHSMAYDSRRERVLVFGGPARGTEDPRLKWPGDLWEWDGVRWTRLSEFGPQPMEVTNPGLAYDQRRGRLVLYGGSTYGTWEWDGSSWSPVIPPKPTPSESR